MGAKSAPICPVCKHKMWIDIILEADPHEYRWECMCESGDLERESSNFDFTDEDWNKFVEKNPDGKPEKKET